MSKNLNELNPRSILIEIPKDPSARIDDDSLLTYTMLFRPNSNIKEALGETYARHREDKKLRVISAGCSIGAEIDTVLSLHNQVGRVGRVAILGIDKSSFVINLARRGRYNTLPSAQGLLTHEPARTLREGGFDYELATDASGLGYFAIDSALVRASHEVNFQNASVENADAELADLVMANNLLYNLTAVQATKVVGRLGQLVAPGGVLSIGGGSSLPMYAPDADISYNEWLGGAGQLLVERHGLTPLPVGAASTEFVTHPTLFVRD